MERSPLLRHGDIEGSHQKTKIHTPLVGKKGKRKKKIKNTLLV